MHLEADIENLNKDTGWYPKTEFAVGIRTLLAGVHAEGNVGVKNIHA